jgi:atypical dual specificity phosphatase
MRGFYWLIADELAGCARPGGRGQTGGHSAEDGRAALDADLAWLSERGIGAVLSLTEAPLDSEALARYGLESLQVPVRDMTAPTPQQLDLALGFIDRQRSLGRTVVVHCLMGQGRTGTVLAAYLIRRGMSPAEALTELRRVCPGAVENPEQEHALHAFATRHDWIV